MREEGSKCIYKLFGILKNIKIQLNLITLDMYTAFKKTTQYIDIWKYINVLFWNKIFIYQILSDLVGETLCINGRYDIWWVLMEGSINVNTRVYKLWKHSWFGVSRCSRFRIPFNFLLINNWQLNFNFRDGYVIFVFLWPNFIGWNMKDVYTTKM